MRVLQGSFPRFHDRLSDEECGERGVVMHLGVKQFNVRTRIVGLNQTLNFYMPNISREANMFLE